MCKCVVQLHPMETQCAYEMQLRWCQPVFSLPAHNQFQNVDCFWIFINPNPFLSFIEPLIVSKLCEMS